MQRLVVAASLIFASALVSRLPGQIQTGRIVGTVYDPNKAVVPISDTRIWTPLHASGTVDA